MGTSGDLCIGHDCGLPAPYDNRYFKGSVDEVRVYADALSASAVKKMYTEQKEKLTTGGGQTTQCTDSDKNATYPDGKNYFVKGEVFASNASASKGGDLIDVRTSDRCIDKQNLS